jgi:hypothetical protein
VGQPLTVLQVQEFNILGVLVVFTVVVAAISHNLEYSLKQVSDTARVANPLKKSFAMLQTYLDEYRLQTETERLKNEKRFSTALLHSMLPAELIADLQVRSSVCF